MNPTVPTPEQLPGGQVPEVPQAPEVTAPPAAAAPVAPQPMPQLPAAPVAPVPQSDAPAAQAGVASPVIAEDVDVIEKEWVDQAEAVVKQTEGDPHAEEEAVEQLQVDYLKKRYDHTVEKPAD